MEISAIPQESISGMLFTAAVGITLPFVLLFFARIKLKAKYSAFFIGCVTYICAVLFLKAFFTGLMIKLTNGVIRDNLMLYALFSGVTAALFEEFGRYVSLRYWMKNSLAKENAVMYGIGHGSIYSVAVVGLSYVANITLADAVNSGRMTEILAGLTAEEAGSYRESLQKLAEAVSSDFYVAGIEQFYSLALQIVLSYLIYRSIRDNDYRMIVTAILLHFMMEFTTIMLSQILPIMTVEAILIVIAVALVAVMVKFYKQEPAMEKSFQIKKSK